jgi:hypothetical protein
MSRFLPQSRAVDRGDHIDKHHGKPFVWTAKAAGIPEKVKRSRALPNNYGSSEEIVGGLRIG